MSVLVVLMTCYLILQFVARTLKRTDVLRKNQSYFYKGIRHVLLIFEPIGILVLTGVFVLINPMFHGLIIGLILLLGLSHLKDYLNGRVLQFDNVLSVGKHISTSGLLGIITKITRLGIYSKTNKGTQFISYSRLYSDGFHLLSDNEFGGFYQLKIEPIELNQKINYQVYLTDLFASAPYVDRNHKTDISLSDENGLKYMANVSVKEKQHVIDLIALLTEQGFACKISKK